MGKKVQGGKVRKKNYGTKITEKKYGIKKEKNNLKKCGRRREHPNQHVCTSTRKKVRGKGITENKLRENTTGKKSTEKKVRGKKVRGKKVRNKTYGKSTG